MKTKTWAIILMVLCTFLTSSAQLLYKQGSNTVNFSLPLQDPSSIQGLIFLAIGLFLYGIGAVLMVVSFRGGDVSVLYPIIATSYIWVTLFSGILFKESVNAFKWMGIAAIIAGIILINLGSKDITKFIEPI